MSWSCREAACVDPARIDPARQQTAPRRRSGQTSRRVFGRRVPKAVRPGVVALEREGGGSERDRMRDARRDAAETQGSAGGHEDTLVAVNRYRRLRRTARHVVGHLVHRVRCRQFSRRHFVDHRLCRSVRRCRRHDRPGNRGQREARDHHGREQPAYGDMRIHAPRLSQICGREKVTVGQFFRAGIDRNQMISRGAAG